ncbi:cartilage matrix protein-like isoform X2 [Littorina saxatilis]|uniref:cartilage matrix protein-like isoform X2 n=1 Tax=Littorina saxatilis TaxID=31220 RepID=UPI0038B48F14
MRTMVACFRCLAAVVLLTSKASAQLGDQCKLKADVVFIVDSSRSIWPPHFEIEKQFLANITTQLNVGPDATHVGVISFSKGARVELYLNNMTDDVAALQEKILNIAFMSGGRTETYLALSMAREELFSPANGARDDVPHIIIIITDGDSSDRKMTKKQADIVRDKGIQVFVVGIGHYLDPEQLMEIATESSETYVHTVDSFTSLESAMPNLIPAACRATTTSPPEKITTPQKETPGPDATDEPMISDETKKVCNSKKADVVFVLDKSSSITSGPFRTQLNFVSDVMTIFNIEKDHTHVSVVTFDYGPKIEFGLTTYYSKSKVRKAILDIEYTAGSTNTFLALELVAKHVLTPEGGAREGVARVVIVVTDGQSSDPGKTKAWADTLKKGGAYVFSIGVGNSTDEEELVSIGSEPARDFVFKVNGYNALNTIQDILAYRACEVPSGDLFARCQQRKNPADVMFVTDFTHAGGRDVTRTTDIIKEVAGGFITPGKVRAGLVSSECPDVTDVGWNQSSTAEEFAAAVTSVGQGDLAEVLSRARQSLTVVSRGARRGVKRLAVVFVHGPISDLKAATREVQRAKSSANRPGVEFIFVGVGEGVQEKQLLQLSAERDPKAVRLLMGNVGKGEVTWQDVLTQVCEALESE